MGRKTTTTGPPRSTTSKRTKMGASSSSVLILLCAANAPYLPNRAQATRGNRPTPPHCILKGKNFDTGAFLLYQLLSQASSPKSPIACGSLITAIAYAWDLEAQVMTMTPLFLGGRLHSATCIQMEMFKIQGGCVCIKLHGHALFPLLNPTKTNCMDASNWVYEDAIDMESDEEEPQPQGGDIGGGGGGDGVEGVAGSSRAILPDEEMYEPPLTRSHTEASSSGFNEAHFYQYMDDHFSRLNLRLDAINEW
ncbi:hypothetical protein Cgig2_016943 [Carnegiea gigantea]|uniref:Uncharacterized protein n=1 Tax=Carnegiea gigantea TaxID=171969 RepID=A0A9Q1JQ82_9CARY|nr:hypothetical protein Cgig2_016943 [Carnegiea gigantea]